jgi:hypothetical protein
MIQAALNENIALRYHYGDDECQGDLGLARFWTQHGQVAGGDTKTNSTPIGPGGLMPLRRPLITGGKDSDAKITFTAQNQRAVIIEADPLMTIPTATLTVPLTIIAYGNQLRAVSCAPACQMPDGRILTLPMDPSTMPAGGMPAMNRNPLLGR